MLTQEQIKEKQRQACQREIADASLEASGLLIEIARYQWRTPTPISDLANLAQVRAQLDRAEAAVRLLAEDAERKQAGGEDEIERARRQC